MPYLIFLIFNVLPSSMYCFLFYFVLSLPTYSCYFFIPKSDEVPISCSTVVGNYKDEDETGEIYTVFLHTKSIICYK
jgi:hypothetical protein